MKIIERNYLKELIDVVGTPDIKVITGVRRSGKSKLLEMFRNYIKENIKNVKKLLLKNKKQFIAFYFFI